MTSHAQNDSGRAFQAFPVILSLSIVAMLVLEKRRPLRSQTESKLRHDLRNTAVGVLSALAIRLTEKPLTDRLTKLVEKNRVGLLPHFKLPRFLETAAALILLDYTLYLWHVLTHKNKFLWRFHEVHHLDLNLTASTSIRFHFIEMVISAAWRSAQVILIGVSGKTLKLWQNLVMLEIMFHHSNIRLPITFERVLTRFIVTPRMHAIHHSTVKKETGSNWSSGLTLWDWMHGTLRLDVPQNEIKIGVPAYGSENDIKLLQVLKKPFKRQRRSFQESLNIERSTTSDPYSLTLEAGRLT